MRLLKLAIALAVAGCASQAPSYYTPPAGLNEYAQMQDYLDCHGSWREHACFVERGYTEVTAGSLAPRTEPPMPSIAHSRP